MYSDALALLGLIAAHAQPPAQAITYLRVNQCANGGFGHDPGCAQADVDTTALVLSALSGSGVTASDSLRSNAVRWLRSMRTSSGLFPSVAGGEPNANSTGLAICALATAGSPVTSSAILSFRDPSGGFRYLRGDKTANDYATEQALPAVVGATYPLAAGAKKYSPNPRPSAVQSRRSPTAFPSGSSSPRVLPDGVVGSPSASASSSLDSVTPTDGASALGSTVTSSRPSGIAGLYAALVTFGALLGGTYLAKVIRRRVNRPRP